MQQSNPKRAENLIINDDADAPTFMNPQTGQLLITNKVGQRIIELADGTRNVEAIGEQITQEFSGAERAYVLGKVEQFLKESTEKGIVTWT